MLEKSSPTATVQQGKAVSIDYLKTIPEFDNAKLQTSLLVIDFTASWCGPCKKIGPVFEKMAWEYPMVKFTKCDVDEADKELIELCEVAAMPTFKFFKAGKQVDEMQGADEAGLKAKLTALSTS